MRIKKITGQNSDKFRKSMNTTRLKQSSELQCVALHGVMTVVLEANVYRKLVNGH